MKAVKGLITVLILIFLFLQPAPCQFRTKRTSDDTEKKGLLKNVLQQLADSIARPKIIPTEKNERIAYEFTQAKIYPSDDALEIIYILNPWLKNTGSSIPVSRHIVLPEFPPPSNEEIIAWRKNYLAVSRPDPAATARLNELTFGFDMMFSEFLRTFKELPASEDEKRPVLDTINLFKDRILPALKAKASSLPKAKLDYINSNLADINLDIRDFIGGHDALEMAYYIMKDLIATANYTGARDLSGYAGDYLFINASYIEKGKDFSPPFVETKVIRCKLYVYDQSGHSFDGRFDIYVSPYVTTFSLNNCRDTIRYLVGRGGAIGPTQSSTGLVNIPNNSNWAIYCKDRKYGPTYLVDQKYNYQNILNKDDTDASDFKICLLFYGK